MIKLGITLGDPAGIGYEIVAKALKRSWKAEIYLIGNMGNFRRILDLLKINSLILKKINFVEIPGELVDFGKPSKEGGEISLKSVKKGIELAMKGEIDSLVTAPINKEAWKLAGSEYIDHTSLLANLTKSKEVSTVFETKSLRIIFMTKHIPLLEACKSVTRENVENAIVQAYKALKVFGIENGSIAVAALNPHAGEDGIIGREEIDVLKPVIKDMKNKYNVHGPFPADSVFYLASKGVYDIVVSLYHDQGHIAAKMYDFRRTISLNPGLPFLRTSVDHGTAFDIAGKGIADETSMVEAIKKAIKYSKTYKERVKEIF